MQLLLIEYREKICYFSQASFALANANLCFLYLQLRYNKIEKVKVVLTQQMLEDECYG